MIYINGESVAPMAEIPDGSVTLAKLGNDVFEYFKTIVSTTLVYYAAVNVTIPTISYSTVLARISADSGYEGVCFDMSSYGLESGKTYTISFTFRTTVTSYDAGLAFGYTAGTTAYTYFPAPNSSDTLHNLNRNNTPTSYTLNYTAGANNYLTFFFRAVENSGEAIITDFSITEVTE